MSVTGTQVMTQVRPYLGYTQTNDKFSETEELAAVNAAIMQAWPKIHNVQVDSSQTLASTTFEYSPSSVTPEVDKGWSVAYVALTSAPKRLLRRIGQRRSTTTWTVLVPADTASRYNGKVLHLMAKTRVATISTIGTAIELPLQYLVPATVHYLATFAMSKGATFDNSVYTNLSVKWQAEMDRALTAARTIPILPDMIPTVQDVGLFNEDDDDDFVTP